MKQAEQYAYSKPLTWNFKLNNRTRISILTPVGETDNATTINGIGQGSFAAARASSIDIGIAVYDITNIKYWKHAPK